MTWAPRPINGDEEQVRKPTVKGVVADIEVLRDALQQTIDEETAKFEALSAGKVAEVKRLDGAIRTLTGESKAAPRKRGRADAGKPRGGKLINAILAYLAERPGEEVPAGVLVKAVIDSGATNSPTSVAGALHRLAQHGRLAHRDIDNNRRLYSLPETAQ